MYISATSPGPGESGLCESDDNLVKIAWADLRSGETQYRMRRIRVGICYDIRLIYINVTNVTF